jgi:hypothetical protein
MIIKKQYKQHGNIFFISGLQLRIRARRLYDIFILYDITTYDGPFNEKSDETALSFN